MPGTQPRERVKHRPWRTTEVEVVEAGGVACVKRFHDARWPSSMGGRVVGRWRDLRRARREERRLRELAQAGLPVPEVLGVRETPDGVELRTRWIPGARTVAEILEDPSGPPHRLAGELGRLLGALHRAGFVHGDLHPGNVVVDADQRAWLVDAAAIRRGTSSNLRDLTQAAAHARELTSARFRARFLVAYARAAPFLRRDEARAFAVVLEAAGRSERRKSVEAESDRWMRESGVCAHCVEGDVSMFVPHAFERDVALALVRRALDGEAPTGIELARGTEARAAWICAARLTEHRVPVLRPVAFVQEPVPLALFALPAGARELDARRGADAQALGTLAGILSDRLLALPRAAVVLDAHGKAHVDPRSGLDASRHLGQGTDAWRELVRGASRIARLRFAAAFLREHRGSSYEYVELRAGVPRG